MLNLYVILKSISFYKYVSNKAIFTAVLAAKSSYSFDYAYLVVVDNINLRYNMIKFF
jgi:hypothetical protein